MSRRNSVYVLDFDKAFDQREQVAATFLSRLGDVLDFRGKNILDVGCGLGRTCYYAVQVGGAQHATGVDIAPKSIEYARQRRPPELEDRVDFQLIDDLDALGDRTFDLILSEDSFEHIMEPERMLDQMVQHLRPGGELAIGFSPLWHSPKGGHIEHITPLPWAHLLFPERIIFAEAPRFYPAGRQVPDNWADYGINKMSFARFRRAVTRPDLQPVFWAVNQHEDPRRTRVLNPDHAVTA